MNIKRYKTKIKALYFLFSFRETTRNKDMEDLTNMTASLESKKTRYYNDLEQLHQKLSFFIFNYLF